MTFARANNGIDGAGFEFIYRRTADETPPDQPVTTNEQDAQNQYIPTGWTDEPAGPSRDLPFEWVCSRAGSNRNWGKFSFPSVWARYADDGAGSEWIYRRTNSSTPPPTPTTTATEDATDDHEPPMWSDDRSA